MHNLDCERLSSSKFIRKRQQILATHRNYTDDKRYTNKDQIIKLRLTQKIVRPVAYKKIKSEETSAQSPQKKMPRNGGNTGFVKGIPYQMPFYSIKKETEKNRIINDEQGRKAALGNHSPQKIKIKMSGLIMEATPLIMDNTEKLHSKTKYIISKRKNSYDYKNKIDDKLGESQAADLDTEETPKCEMYYKGIRKIKQKGQFTDENGNCLVQIGDSIIFRFQILQEIGVGAFGKVYKCFDHKNQEVVALKIIKALTKLNKQAKIQVEILEKALAKQNQSRNGIVRIKEWFMFHNHSCISYEMLSINLYEYMKINRFQSVPQYLMVKFAIQILHSLSFMHNNKIVHCDIKPENIMLKEAHKTGIKIIDFGSSCYEEQQFYTYIQSRYYRAPEVILGLKYTSAIDMWSLGCVLAELYLGYPLFPGQNQQQQLMMYIEILGYPPISMLEQGARRKRFFNDNFECRIIQSAQNYRIPKGLTFEKALRNCQNYEFINFIKRCIDWDPTKRFTPKQALMHDWILQGIPANIRARHIVEVTGEGITF